VETSTSRPPVFLQYCAEDFPLYMLSILLPGIMILPILPHRFEQVLLIGGLAYLTGFFVLTHGARFESNIFRVVAEGVARYPGILARSWRTGRDVFVPIVVLFLLALVAEHLLRPQLAGTIWLKPFPHRWAIWLPFLIVTLFRVAILVAHLHRASVVREVLERSPRRKATAALPIHQHIFQAFVTGMFAHLSLVAPCALFFMWTNPSNLREALLLGGFLLWSSIARPLRKRKVLKTPGLISNHLVYQNHTIAHQSRFYFTVFHGHHHDAIPSALIGSAAGSGFLENADRGLTWLDFLNSIVVVQMKWAYIIAFDMIVHQYIPGVFPFAKPNVSGLGHHVTHHFGSALPLGVIFYGYVEPRDMKNGYKPDNAVTRWFIGEVEQREGLDPELRRRYLSLNDYGVTSKASSMPESTPVALAASTTSVPSKG
jgi:hypothetical protein